MHSIKVVHIHCLLVTYTTCLGLYEGYNDHVEDDKKLDWFSFDILNGNGDIRDLLKALDPNSIPNFATMSKEEIKFWVSREENNFYIYGYCADCLKFTLFSTY